jgi:hypothetical protein
MPGKISINYHREGTTDTSGRLYERIAQAFGQKNLFVDCTKLTPFYVRTHQLDENLRSSESAMLAPAARSSRE